MNIHLKNHPSARRGFTLIELLVVISIIALLAGLAMPVYNVIMRKAREVQAKAVMQGLVVAIKSFQVEYNKFPLAPTMPPTDNSASMFTTGAAGPADAAAAGSLMGCLTATDTANNPTNNPRLIQFFNPPPLKGNVGYDPTQQTLTDPWGQFYNVNCDYAGIGIFNPNPITVGTAASPLTIPGTVIVWSNGVDTQANTQDDLGSWH